MNVSVKITTLIVFKDLDDHYFAFVSAFSSFFSLSTTSQHANLAGTLSGHGSWVLSVTFSPDNAHFASR